MFWYSARGSGLTGLSEEAVEIGLLEQAIVVHWMAMLSDFSAAPPIAERVRGDAKIFSGFLDAEIAIELVHFRNSPTQMRPMHEHEPCLTLPIWACWYNQRRTNSWAKRQRHLAFRRSKKAKSALHTRIQRVNETLARPSGYPVTIQPASSHVRRITSGRSGFAPGVCDSNNTIRERNDLCG